MSLTHDHFCPNFFAAICNLRHHFAQKAIRKWKKANKNVDGLSGFNGFSWLDPKDINFQNNGDAIFWGTKFTIEEGHVVFIGKLEKNF